MTRFEYINQNTGLIKYLVKSGFIDVEILTHWAINCRYDYHRKVRGEKKKWHFNCASFTADDFKMSESMIFEIIKWMEEEI
jgi:hypothetical protein